MTPLKTRQERFCRWFGELAAAQAVGGRRLTRDPRWSVHPDSGPIQKMCTFVTWKTLYVSIIYEKFV